MEMNSYEEQANDEEVILQEEIDQEYDIGEKPGILRYANAVFLLGFNGEAYCR